jgi:hypothetical protein
MKKLLIAVLALGSLSSFACVDISGKYLCPVEAEEEFGERTVQFKKSPILDMYSMKVGNDAIMFELGAWNPGIDPNSGEIDHSVETMAECQGNTVILKIRGDRENETFVGSFDVTKKTNGINLSVKNEGKETYNFDCVKQ